MTLVGETRSFRVRTGKREALAKQTQLGESNRQKEGPLDAGEGFASEATLKLSRWVGRRCSKERFTKRRRNHDCNSQRAQRYLQARQFT